MPTTAQITLRPLEEGDIEFLFRLYVSTRAEEKDLLNWPDEEWNKFMRMQFTLQHTQYMKGHINPSFDIILENDIPAGKLYVDHRADEIRLIDIAVLPEFRRRGIAGSLMKELLLAAEKKNKSISLHVEKNNPILGYYQRLGFQVEEDKGIYLFMVRRHDAKIAGNGEKNVGLRES